MIKRIIIDILLLLSVFFWGPILPVIGALFFLYYFESFYEIMFVGLIIDVLYGSPLSSLGGFSHTMTFIAVVLLISSFFIKKKLKFYSNR